MDATKVLFFLGLIQMSVALQCYNCTSIGMWDSAGSCATLDLSDPTITMITCGDKETQCLMEYSYIPSSGTRWARRRCAESSVESAGCGKDPIDTDWIDETIQYQSCACSQDSCNDHLFDEYRFGSYVSSSSHPQLMPLVLWIASVLSMMMML